MGRWFRRTYVQPKYESINTKSTNLKPLEFKFGIGKCIIYDDIKHNGLDNILSVQIDFKHNDTYKQWRRLSC